VDVCGAFGVSDEYRALSRRRVKEDSMASGVSPIRKYLPVYFTLLCISGIEFFVAYQHLSMRTLVAVLLILAMCSAALAVMFFMHLAEERRGLFLTLIPAIVFVLLMMNMIWADGYRLRHLKPFPS
jgi:cytochrome c oxidase subunit IV